MGLLGEVMLLVPSLVWGWDQLKSSETASVSCVNLWLITGRHRILCHPVAYYRETPRWAMHVRTKEIKVQESAQGDNTFSSNKLSHARESGSPAHGYDNAHWKALALATWHWSEPACLCYEHTDWQAIYPNFGPVLCTGLIGPIRVSDKFLNTILCLVSFGQVWTLVKCNFGQVTDRQTYRKWHIRAHHAYAPMGSTIICLSVVGSKKSPLCVTVRDVLG